MLEKHFRRSFILYVKEKYDGDVYIIPQEGQGVGVSDLLLCYKGRFCAIELKGSDNRYYGVTPAQKVFLKKIRQSGGIAFSIRHSDNWKEELHNLLEEKIIYEIE